MATISNLAVKLSLNAVGFASETKAVTTAVTSIGESAKNAVFGVRKLSDESDRAQGSLSRLASQAKSTVAALIGVGSVAGSVVLGVKLAAEFEQTEIAFKTMLGTAEKAKEMLDGIVEFAAKTPFEIPELAKAAKTLLAYQIPAEEILITLRRLGDVSSSTGANIQELALSYGKASSQGRLLSQDVREFTGRGVPLIKLFSKQFGVAESEVQKLIESGKIGFAQLELAIAQATAKGGMFYQSTIAQSRTLAGAWSTLKDSVNILFRSFGEAFVAASGLPDFVTSLTSGADSFRAIATFAGVALGKLVKWITDLIPKTFAVVVAWKAFAATVGIVGAVFKVLLALKLTNWALSLLRLPTIIGLFVRAIKGIPAAFHLATKAVAFFMALSGPKQWIALAGGIIVATLAVLGLNKAYEYTSGEMATLSEEAAAIKKDADDMQKALQKLELKSQFAASMQNAAESTEIAAKQMEKYAEAFSKAKDIRMDVSDKLAYFNESPIDAKIREMKAAFAEVNRQTGLANPYNYTVDQKQDMERTHSQMLQIEALEKQKKINEQIADIQKAAAQAHMTDAQRKIDDLKREGATAAQVGRMREALAAKERAEAAKKSRDDAVAAMKKRIGTPEAPKSLYEQLMGIKNNVGTGLADSPKALLRGTAEADLAANRQKNPVEKLTELQKTQIARLERQITLAEQQLQVAENNNDVVVQF